MGKIPQCGWTYVNGYKSDKNASYVVVNSDLFFENSKIGSSNNKDLKIWRVSDILYLSKILLISIEERGTELMG